MGSRPALNPLIPSQDRTTHPLLLTSGDAEQSNWQLTDCGKIIHIVIPSEARNLSSGKRRKERFLGAPRTSE